MSERTEKMLVAHTEGHGMVLVLGAVGRDAERAMVINQAGAREMYFEQGPEGRGISVWEGEVKVNVSGLQIVSPQRRMDQFRFEGFWRRATVDDMEEFGVPLSESVEVGEVPASQEELVQDNDGWTPRLEARQPEGNPWVPKNEVVDLGGYQ